MLGGVHWLITLIGTFENILYNLEDASIFFNAEYTILLYAIFLKINRHLYPYPYPEPVVFQWQSSVPGT